MLVTMIKQNSETYHGLVDMTSSLEFDDAICVSGSGLCVFSNRPFLWGRLILHPLNFICALIGRTRKNSHVLVYQLTTTAPTTIQFIKIIIFEI